MGKQKIDRLLAQLQDNQNQDIQNAAAIFTVAQSAVNHLDQIEQGINTEPTIEEPNITKSNVLPTAPLKLTKADLINRYGSYNACRKVAKQTGITFSRSPRWPQLVAAFNYLEACQACVHRYMKQYPNPELSHVSLTLKLTPESDL
ncbi:MAG: hypothetical protein AAF152_09655 [Cyanobacteria bacterium P01_A01_bin.114]